MGKLEDGIVVPLKPKLKFDTTGVGFDYSKEYVNDWWAQRYDEALKKVDVSEETVKVSNHFLNFYQDKGEVHKFIIPLPQATCC